MYIKLIPMRLGTSRQYSYLDISSLDYRTLNTHQKFHYIESYLKAQQNNRFNISALQEITTLCIDLGNYKKALKYGQRLSGLTKDSRFLKKVWAMKAPKKNISSVQEMITAICRGTI